MKKGILKNGFEFEVDENVLDDMELIDALSESQGENPLAISEVTKKLLGKEQRKRLYDHLRRDNGTVPIEEVSDAVVEMIEALGEAGKN